MSKLTEALESSRRTFQQTVEGLAPAQWTFQPAPGRWSILEVTEHLATVEASACRLLSGAIFDHPATEATRLETRDKDELIRTALGSSRAFQAPQQVQPKGRWPAPAEAIATLEDSRDRVIAAVSRDEHRLRDYCFPHPLLGMLDGYQWGLFLAVHLERHTRQIAAIKAMPGFPAAG